MYEQFWGLSKKPFSNTPDPLLFYCSKAHEEALVRLAYTITQSKGVMLLTGASGVGKTFLCRTLLAQLIEDGACAGLMTHPNLTPEEFLREAVHELGGSASSENKSETLQILRQIAFDQLQAGHETVLIIDEAHLILNLQTLEEIRLLLNMETEERFLITLILCGQPEIRQRLQRVPLLNQRISLAYEIPALTRPETTEYIAHRFGLSGGDPSIFESSAIDEIFSASAGVPRAINDICDLALLIGSGTGKATIDHGLIETVLEDLRENASLSSGDSDTVLSSAPLDDLENT